YVNRPAISTALGFWDISSPGLAVNADPALATAVQNELGGDKKLSVWLGSDGSYTVYHSREVVDANKRPKLIVTYDFVQVLEPVADAKVIASQPNSNFGSATDFSVGPAWYHPSQQEHAYLRFDLSTLPAHARISSVKLQAMAYTGYAWGGDGNVYTHLVQNDSWSEGDITWNNQPAISGSQLGYWWLWYDYRYVDSLGVNESPALAATARSELNGDKKLSVRLSSPGYITNYYSREVADANKRPKLEVHYVEPELCDVQPNVPVLTLNGASAVMLECGLSTWTDPGARATDACGSLEVHRYNSGSDAYGPGPNTGAEGSYSVQYLAWSTTGGTVSALRTVHVNDTTAPSLRLNGAAQMTHTCGSQFVDPGVEALDACYGNVSPTVRVTGSVNGWAAGTYTLRYDVTDSGGNSAAPVTRTVNVVNCPW
ncbi:immunoglobulin-like domain-containing protein, partial [Hyalangium sp.]|uniref:immunoglobulin-like domain-containing protein n=1 Tax=Hyalangium sp. TaxID=2028555 RepID=UPI002D6E5933